MSSEMRNVYKTIDSITLAERNLKKNHGWDQEKSDVQGIQAYYKLNKLKLSWCISKTVTFFLFVS